MLESNGLVTIAFKRSLIKDGIGKPAGCSFQFNFKRNAECGGDIMR